MAAFDWSTKWGFLVIPAVCGFGCLTNLISVLVFINPKMKDNSFKYLLAIAISNIFYLGLGSYSFLYICTGCPSQLSYFTNVYYNYVVHYVCSTLSIFCILADIYLSLLRYLVLKNKTFLQNISYLKVCPILFLISSLFYIAPMFLKEIKPIKQIKVNNTVVYTAYFAFDNSVGATPFGKTLPIVITSIRIILATVVLTSVNVLNALEFRKRYSKRVKHTTNATMTTFTEGAAQNQQQTTEATQKKDHSSKASRNITIMVMFECGLSTLGICPYAVAFILSNVQPATDALYTYGVTSSGILFFTHGLNLFVYLAFNKIFREVLYGYLKFKFTT